jgi:hypothetical protein
MSIYISLETGGDAAIFDALLTISGCDPGLSSTPYGTLATVGFTPQRVPGPAAVRLQTIVDHVASVYVFGFDQSFVLDDGTPIVTEGAIGYPDGDNLFRVYVDVSQAGGRGYRATDANNNYVFEPLASILYHELAHVYHIVIVKDAPREPNGELDYDRDQLVAIADENQFRQSIGLPLRNPTNVDFDKIGPPTVGPTSIKGCNDGTFSLDGFFEECKKYFGG